MNLESEETYIYIFSIFFYPKKEIFYPYSRNIKIVTKTPRFLLLSTKQIAEYEIDKITILSGLRRGPYYFRG